MLISDVDSFLDAHTTEIVDFLVRSKCQVAMPIDIEFRKPDHSNPYERAFVRLASGNHARVCRVNGKLDFEVLWLFRNKRPVSFCNRGVD